MGFRNMQEKLENVYCIHQLSQHLKFWQFIVLDGASLARNERN